MILFFLNIISIVFCIYTFGFGASLSYLFITYVVLFILYYFFQLFKDFEASQKYERRQQAIKEEENRIKEQQRKEEERQKILKQEEERKKRERARIEQEKRDEEHRIKELRRKEEEAYRKAEEIKKIAKMKETEELMSDHMHELFKDLKNYSFSFSKQLQELVQNKYITPYDRQVIIQKIDQEHGSFKKLFLSKKDSIISSALTPKEFFSKEIQILSKLQNYHQHFLDEIQTINSIGISDKVERIYKKKIAEEDYNDIRNQIFSSIAILTDLFFSLRHEDDEFATIEVSNDDFY